MPPTTTRRGEVGFSDDCLCAEEKIAMTTIAKPIKTDELRRRALKNVIDICENSISRNDLHMTIQCPQCAKCRTCKEIRKINASSYNEFMEQQVLDQLVKYVAGKNGEPGYFTSPLPLKPFEINSVKGNRITADEQNKRRLIKLQDDPQALKQVKEEMENLQEHDEAVRFRCVSNVHGCRP